MDKKYHGLSNLGATCYMNSLLQTLYMTPQFRDSVYQWKYNERLHPEPARSILYQLQKLFGKLQKSYPGEINTRELIKSFNWQDQQAQMQQDIQEFNRVLFQALEKSLMSKKQIENNDRNHFVRQLYQGEMVHYTHCKQCQNQSQREQIFQDLLITVKNPYEKVYNSSAQLGIQRYMKPEILDEDNMYFCQICNKKVQAQRGVRFLKLPKLLNIILRRFDFDYFTFQRKKVNDRVEFPYVLNYNRYMQGYDNIPEKLNEDSSAYFKTQNIPKKTFPTSSTTNTRRVVKKPLVTNIAGKKKINPSANTKSFLSEMRKKKMGSQVQNDDLIFISGSTPPVIKQEMPNVTKSTTDIGMQTKQIPKNITKSAELEVSNSSSKNQKIDISTIQVNESKENQQQKTEQKSAQLTKPGQLPVPPPFNLIPPQISQSYCESNKVKSEDQPMTMEQELKKKLEDKERLNQQKQQRLKQLAAKNEQLIQTYLKEGPLVYELYSVLVHNGSATHGHYYSYIKSFQNGKWFCFNDERVNQVNVQEIQNTFGGSGTANAYALYYRQVQRQNERNERRTIIPKYIETVIDQQIVNLKIREHQKLENLENVLTLKIHYQLYVKQLQILKSSSLELCLQKARDMFNLSEETVALNNSRLRMYNAVSDIKLQTFSGKQKQSLEELRIGSFKTLLLQTKRENQVFEQFVAGKINLRVVLWEIDGENLQCLDQFNLKCHKVRVTKNAKMSEVQCEIKKRREQILQKTKKQFVPNSDICIIKRHQNDEYSYHQVINMQDYKQKTLDQLMVIQNQILYIEEDSDNLKWPQEFEDQIYRINIRFNNTKTNKIETILTDTRKTLGELKETICAIIQQDPQETIMKSGATKSGMELRILTMTMKDAKFITGKMLFLEKGIPAKQGQIRIQLYMAEDVPAELHNRLHQFQYISDVPIGKEWKASEVKELFIKIVKKYKNLDLQKNNFRIREKVADKMGKIYREKPMKEQQLIEKRDIAIQMKVDKIQIKQFAIYVRIWDPETWSLSEKFEIVVNKGTDMIELGSLIYNAKSDIEVQDIQICRILSIHKFSILDLCDMEYFPLTDTSVIAEPLFVNADGLLYIIKNKDKQPRLLTKQQQIKFGGQIKNLAMHSKKRGNQNYIPKKQKGVFIDVAENKQDNEPENKNEQKQEEK